MSGKTGEGNQAAVGNRVGMEVAGFDVELLVPIDGEKSKHCVWQCVRVCALVGSSQ